MEEEEWSTDEVEKMIQVGILGQAVSPPYQLEKRFIGDFAVSTVNSLDMGWETAVARQNESWHVVERYETKEQAIAGHARWCERAAEGLTTVTDIGYPGAIEPKEVTL